MKKPIYNLLIAGMVLGASAGLLPAQTADQTLRARTPQQTERDLQQEQQRLDRQQGLSTDQTKHDRAVLEQRTKELNSLAKKKNGMDFALKIITVETGVPAERVRAIHKKNPDFGAAGIMNACVLADNTKKDPEEFIRQHDNGKPWAQLATDNNVPMNKLTERLDHMEHALSDPTHRRK